MGKKLSLMRRKFVAALAATQMKVAETGMEGRAARRVWTRVTTG